MWIHPVTAYRKKHGLNLREFGALVSKGAGEVWQWENGRMASLETRVMIDRATKGEVPANGWEDFETPPAETAIKSANRVLKRAVLRGSAIETPPAPNAVTAKRAAGGRGARPERPALAAPPVSRKRRAEARA